MALQILELVKFEVQLLVETNEKTTVIGTELPYPICR